MVKRKSKVFYQLVAMVLCLAMVLPFVPALVWATDSLSAQSEETVYVLAGSDLQGTYENDQHDTSEAVSNIKNILSTIGKSSYDGFMFLGDYNLGADDNTVNGLAVLKNALTGYTFTNQYYLQGNHDAAPDGSNGLTTSGGHTGTYYDVYALNWEVYGAATTEEQVEAQANQLESWLASRTVGDKPIFILSHVPLHYSQRTISHGDAQYAKYLLDVINAAGQRGLNIIFMFGHNHSSAYDRYMGGSTNFVGKGESLWIADLEGVNAAPNERTINFTYMNAGYIGSVGDTNTAVDRDNTMSVFEITGDDVVIRRYDTAGEHALQETSGQWWDDEDIGYELNTNTQASGLKVAGTSIELEVPEKISTNNFAVGTYATVSVKNGESANFDWDIDPVSSTDVAAITAVDDATDSATIDAWYPGTVRVTATNQTTGESASVYIQVVEVAEELIVEDTGEVFYRLVNRLTSGKNYMLINTNSSGSAKALQAAGSGTGTQIYDISVGAYRAGMTFVMKPDVDHLLWTVEGSRIRANQRTSYLAINPLNADDVDVVLYKPAEYPSATYDWSVNEGLYATIGGARWNLVYYLNGSTAIWDASKGIDSRYHTRVYAYEETPLYAIGEVSGREGYVAQNAGTASETDSYIIKTWSNGRVEYIPITMDMLSVDGAAISTATARTVQGVTVTYNGVALCDDFTLTIGNPKTIQVDEYYYYRLTDGLKYEYDENFYLIVTRNTKGDGYLMASSTHGGAVVAQHVSVMLDANGIPCIRPDGVSLTKYNNDSTRKCTQQEWRVRSNFRVYQPNAYLDTGSTYLFGTSNDSYGVLNAGDDKTMMGGYDMTFYANTTDPSDNGYHSVSGKITGQIIQVFIEYVDGSFVTVRDYDRTLGNEVYAYERVTSNTAEVSLLSENAYLNVGTANVGTQSTGSRILITREDGTVETVPVTLGMISGTYNLNAVGKYKNLTVTYGGVTLTTNFTLNVIDPNNPVYPQPGSVKADKVKDTSEFDFDETGVARVDLSTAGVSSTQKLDVLVIVDTSSSVILNTMENGETRLEAMRQSIETLIDDLAKPTADGSLPDIQLAITQFNDYNYFSNVNSLVGHEPAADGGHPTSSNQTIQYYTDVFEMQDFDTSRIQAYSCTNYDVAFRHAYHIVKGRIEANGDDAREQVVIFMTDGICYQYNYISNKYTVDQVTADSSHTTNHWKHWMMGTLDEAGLYNTSVVPSAAMDWYHPEGKNWMAEAIKGSPDSTYKVIDKTDSAYDVGGNYDKNTHLQYVKGLGATMYTIGFGLTVDGDESVEVGRHILTQAASDPSMYFTAENAEELYAAFQSIGLSVRTAASQAVLMDTMGEKFDLQMGVVKDSNGVEHPLRPTITIKGYDLYKVSDVGTVINGKAVTEDMVGQRKSNYPSVILETVTFNDEGTEAYSSRKSGNILQNGIINAMYFQYNTNKYTPDAMGQPMPGYEQFLWNVGTVREQELVLSYYVYLENAMGEDGKGVEDGNYATNEYAALQYVDVNGDEKSIELDSPNLNWVNAKLTIGYYEVDKDGNPIKADGTVTDFNGKNTIKTEDAKEINLNTDISTGELVVPDGYFLYDPSACATIKVHSGVSQNEKDIVLDGDYNDLTWTEGGQWTIEGEKDKQTTYVDGFGGSATNGDHSSTSGDYADTTVWFALVKIQILPDAVVIDFGLPVDITVLPNDIVGGEGFELAAVGPYSATLDNSYTTSLPVGFESVESVAGTYGNYLVNGDQVRFNLQTMKMNGYEKFLYAVKHDLGGGEARYYYASVTVIPATIIYYEDAFTSINLTKTTYTSLNPDGSVNGANTTTGWTPVTGGTVQTEQDEDRVGGGLKLNELLQTVKNDRYGYDSHYVNMATYSNGAAQMVTVNENTYATATFTFSGTGFDVISLTSDKTGLIAVKVTDQDNKQVYFNIVDTFYGYKFENGQWIVDSSDNDALYQVPVMKADLKNFGTYTVTITATYNDFFDHNSKDGKQYDFYLDAIRIYNPAGDGVNGTDTTIRNAYIADGELDPTYEELRNQVIDKNTFDSLNSNQVNGIVFIDGIKDVGNSGDPNAPKPDNKPNMTYQIATYMNYGPNNELYLAPGQAIAFKLENVANLQSVQLAFKTQGDFSTDGSPNQSGVTDGAGTAGIRIYRNGTQYMQMYVKTATDMYYDLTDLVGQYVIIYNFHTDGILSITNIKTTYTDGSASEANAAQVLKVSKRVGTLALETLNADMNEELPENPDVNIPEGGESEGNGSTGSNPGTGDLELNMAMMAMMVCVCMLAVVVLVGYRMKEERE